jgi:tetratricopeptide (TPR) repeat protein
VGDNVTEQPPADATTEPQEVFELTPDIMQHENRRLDRFLSAGVLLLAFFLGAFKDGSSDLWLRFKTGQIIAEQGIPRTDSLSYTAEGEYWVNPSWLFDWSIYLVYGWFGPVTLGVLKALAVVIPAACLLTLRLPGPTQWGAIIGAAIALVAVSTRLALQPELAATVLTALLLSLWFQARYRGRFWILYLAIPLTVLWANLDLTFLVSPIFLALIGLGEALQRVAFRQTQIANTAAWTRREILTVFVVAGLCLLSGLATPYGWRTLVFPYDWATKVLPAVPALERFEAGWHSVLGGEFSRDLLTDGTVLQRAFTQFIDQMVFGSLHTTPWSDIAFSLLFLGALGSFFLNYAQLSFARFAVAVFAVALTVIAERFVGMGVLILVAVTMLNCQEFYLAAWGYETRISRGWLIWSQGGRAVTVVALGLAIVFAFTGWIQGHVGRFGFGIADQVYMVDAEQWLRNLPLKGRLFAFSERTGSYLAYARQDHKNFVDSRWQLFVRNGALAKYSLVRRAFSALDPQSWAKTNDGKSPTQSWKQVFDEYGITHVVVDPSHRRFTDPRIGGPLRLLLDTPELAPLHITDRAVILGRTDSTIDQAVVREYRIDANHLVFRTIRQPPARTERDVIRPWLGDTLWRRRLAPPKGLFTGTAYSGRLYGSDVRSIAKPGGDFLAIAALRDAVSVNPDNPDAHAELARAYERLLYVELEQLTLDEQLRRVMQPQASTGARASATDAPKAAKAPTKTQEASKTDAAQGPPTTMVLPPVDLVPSSALLPLRHRQVMTAYQNAVLAGSTDPDVHLKLASHCEMNGYLDLGLSHLEQAVELLPSSQADEIRQRQLLALEATVQRQRDAYEEMKTRMEQELERAGLPTDRPVELAQMAANLQLVKLARDQIELASLLPIETAMIVPFASELYLSIGFPGKADEQLRFARVQQQLPPGQWERSMAHIRILNGQYDDARKLLERAAVEIHRSRAVRILGTLQGHVGSGSVLNLVNDAGQIQQDLQREAVCLFELGMLRIEMGEPQLAARDFEKALQLVPHFHLRPIVNFYWSLITDEKIPQAPPPIDFEQEIVERYKKPDKDQRGKEKGTAPVESKPVSAVTSPDSTKSTKATTPAK